MMTMLRPCADRPTDHIPAQQTTTSAFTPIPAPQPGENQSKQPNNGRTNGTDLAEAEVVELALEGGVLGVPEVLVEDLRAQRLGVVHVDAPCFQCGVWGDVG